MSNTTARQFATVRECRNGRIIAETQAVGGCPRCDAGEGCGGGLLLRRRQIERVVLSATADTEPLLAGQSLELWLPPGGLLRSAVLAYLLPLTTTFCGAVIASIRAPSDASVAVGAIVGLLCGLGCSGFLMTRWREKIAISWRRSA